MNLLNHMKHVEQIERDIVDNKLDTLVMGMGPTARLLPWIDRKLLLGIRLWGCHDFFRVMPVDDLVLMDSPNNSPRIKMGSETMDIICNSRPKRLWMHQPNAWLWKPHLHRSMESVTEEVNFFVWHRPLFEGDEERPEKFMLEWPRPHCGYVSPLAATTLAWREGARRIGVLGVEMGPDHPNSFPNRQRVDEWFCEIAAQAHEKDGLIKNLSPITYLHKFKDWVYIPEPEEAPDESAQLPS